jgi:choline dehydrogenase
MSSARFESDPEQDTHTAAFAERVRSNQQRLTAELKPRYDFIVCGSGSSGSVVVRGLAENAGVSVLLLEAGGGDDTPSIMEAGQWPLNLGSERDWAFMAQPNPHLNGRSIPLNMGKVLGGGSSINVMVWARGHKNDWDFFAAEARDAAWSYQSVLNIYRRIEDWHGAPDPRCRGTGGPVFVRSAPDPNPVAPAMVEAARSVGIPTFQSQNGLMMEGDGGASIMDLRVRDGMRQSVFRSYAFPYMDRPNLTVLCHALVTRLVMRGKQASGVEIVHDAKVQRIAAGVEVVPSLGAIHTPELLMLSGIGDQTELQRLGIPRVQHLRGVGENFQDHVGFGCVWEYPQPLPPRNNKGDATFFWKSDPDLDSPDLQTCQGGMLMCSAETAVQFSPPASSWTLMAGIARPKSRGRIRLTGANPDDPTEIEANTLAHPDDKAAIACVELCREIGNSAPLSHFVKREAMPGNLKGPTLENFIRDAASSYWHQTCTAKMGHDAMSVVDGSQGPWDRPSSYRRRFHHAAGHNRQHDGAMRCHWRARRRDAEDRPPL